MSPHGTMEGVDTADGAGLWVVATTARAWGIEPRSPRALARLAPWGYVPLRKRRRASGASATPAATATATPAFAARFAIAW